MNTRPGKTGLQVVSGQGVTGCEVITVERVAANAFYTPLVRAPEPAS